MEGAKFSQECVTRASRVMVSPFTWTRHHGNGKTLLHGRTLLNPQDSGEQASYNCTAQKRYVNIMPTHTVAECAHKTQPSMPSSLCLSSEVPADLRVPHHQYPPMWKKQVLSLSSTSGWLNICQSQYSFFFVICIQKLSFPFLPSRSNDHFGNYCFLPIYSSYILLSCVGLKTCLEHASNFFFSPWFSPWKYFWKKLVIAFDRRIRN